MSEAVKNKKNGKEGKGGKGGNILKIAIVVLLAVILVGGAAFAGYFFASKNSTSTAAHSSEAPTVIIKNVTEAYFVAVEGKLINLADTDAKRYAKMTITVAYDSKNKNLPKELEEKKTIIVDSIISTIRSKKAGEFDGKGSDDIKKEMITKINSMLENGRATNIYYSDFLIQ